MTGDQLQDLLRRLRPGGPERRAAGNELFAWVFGLAQRCVRPELRREAAVSVAVKLAGHAPEWAATLDAPDAYAARSLRNLQCDLQRAEERERRRLAGFEAHTRALCPAPLRDEPDEPVAESGDGPLHDPRRRLAHDLLLRVWRHAREGARRGYRPGLDATFAQLSALAFRGATLRALLCSEDPRLEGAPRALAKATAAAHKAHERLRTRLYTAIDDLERSGALQAAEARLAERCMALLGGESHADEGGQP